MTMTPTEPMTLLEVARQWHDAGYCVVPSHEDGTKRPFGPWKQYQHERTTWEQVKGWLESGKYTGIGVICGQVSGNVEMIELEGPGTASSKALDKINKVAAGYGEDIALMWKGALNGCIESSAGGGLHIFIRVSDAPVPGNTKLAADKDGKVLAETRGEGGFVVVAPTPGRQGHDQNSMYRFMAKTNPKNTAIITQDDREAIHHIITEAIHSHVDPITPQTGTTAPPSKTAPQNGLQSGRVEAWQDYAQRTSWAEILAPLGWTQLHTTPDGNTHWRRPGKDEGSSATTLEDGPLFVFSSSTIFPQEQAMSKQHVYALLHHNGDHKAATIDLASKGFGEDSRSADLPSWVPDLTLAESQDTTDENDLLFNKEVRKELRQLLVREHARNQMTTLKLGAVAPLHGTELTEFLSQPDDPVRYRVEDLWPSEGRVLLAAAAKSGKTTMVAANLIPCLVDGGQFLGRFKTDQVTDGAVVLLNMEVGANTLRRWMRETGITNTGNVIVANLRGKASQLALSSEQGRQRFAEWLQRHDASVVVLDPLAPVLASLGLDENANSDVAQFFAWWSEALTLAGVHDDLIVHHTGHAGQRSRGASRLLDEPDAIWTLGKEADEDDGEFASLDPAPRHLAAYGRDVEMGAHLLDFDPITRRLTLTDQPRSAARTNRIEAKVLALMSDGKPRTRNKICEQIGGSRNAVWDACTRLIDTDQLIVAGKAPGGRGELLAMETTL